MEKTDININQNYNYEGRDFELLDIGRLNTYRIQLVMKDKDGNIYRGIAQHYGEIE